MKRMTLAQIISAGLVASVLIGLGFYWLSIAPNQKALENQLHRNESLQAVVDKKKQAEDRVALAEKTREEVNIEWAAYISRKSPPVGVINLAQNRWRLSTQFQTVFLRNIESALVNHIQKSKVRIVKPPGIPRFADDNPNNIIAGYFNYPALPYPVAVVNCGQVQVSGSFSQVLSHVQSWNNLPNYIALADGLILSGTSPNLVGTYNLTVIVFPRGEYINATPVNWIPGGESAGGEGGLGAATAPMPGGPGPGGPGNAAGKLGKGGGG